jgi:hypothetical protein
MRVLRRAEELERRGGLAVLAALPDNDHGKEPAENSDDNRRSLWIKVMARG